MKILFVIWLSFQDLAIIDFCDGDGGLVHRDVLQQEAPVQQPGLHEPGSLQDEGNGEEGELKEVCIWHKNPLQN